MFERFSSLNFIIHFVQHYHYATYGLIFLTSFLESLAIVGAFTPGAVLMSVIGFLIGTGILPAKMVYLILIFGVLAGDLLSFGFGYLLKGKVYTLWPFNRYPRFLSNGTNFFNRHGGKSICIGRFIGPMRAVIPMIAGMLQMSFFRFCFFTVPSAIIWSFVYTIPGLVLGALALEIPNKVVVQFIGYGLLSLLVLSGLIWLMQFSITWLIKQIKKGLVVLVRKLDRYRFFKRWLSNYGNPLRVVTLLCVLVFLGVIFFLLVHCVFHLNERLLPFNRSIATLLVNVRFTLLDQLMLAITILGNPVFLLVLVTLFGGGLVYIGFWREAVFLFSAFSLGVLSVLFFKFVYFFPRPLMVGYGALSSSFPSAHVLLTTMVYGGLAIINYHLSERKKGGFFCGLIIFAVAISRLYLGVHWFTDVLAGWILASLILLVLDLGYEFRFNRSRKVLMDAPLKKMSKFCGLVGIIWWLLNLTLNYPHLSKQYAVIWPKQILSFAQLINAQNPFWTSQLQIHWPLYRQNRLGMEVEAFNLLYIGKIKLLQNLLTNKGWVVHDYHSVLYRVIRVCVDKNFSQHFSPLLPLYNGQRPALILTKKDENNVDGSLFILKLWPSNIDFIDLDNAVWIGNVEYHRALPRFFSWSRFQNFRQPVINLQGSKDFVEDLMGIFQVVNLPYINDNNGQTLDYFWIVKEQ